MKNIFLYIVCFVISTHVSAQQANNNGKEKMGVFSGWVGRWQGEGSIQMGPGEPKKSSVDEQIESRLDGTLIVMEGIGKGLDADNKGSVVHHAFGVLSFDQNSNQYKFKTYLKDGRNTDAWFNVTGENNFQWGFDVPNRKIRYTIVIDPSKKTWKETGEHSADGTGWMKFFEMNLTKVE